MDRFPTLQNDAEKRADNRGWLQVLYESESMVLKRSFSKAGVFRGLHVQMPPSPQVKLIRVVSGRIVDILVDVNDPQHVVHHQELTPADDWVRIGAHYAHGFYAREDTVFEYVCDGAYDEANEHGVSIRDWLRDTLGVENPILSAKDAASPPL